MLLTWFVQVLTLGVILSAGTCGGADPTCRGPSKWFGTSCRFKCHCLNKDEECYDNGFCSTGCAKGWFGPSCQYVDLVSNYTTPSTPSWVYNVPGTNCNPNHDETVTVYLNSTFYFTWLRLHTAVAVRPEDFNIQLMFANQTAVTCSNMYKSKINDTTLDIHCLPGSFFQHLLISGKGVTFLCTVYVSGGRNVALGQNTYQTSNNNDMTTSLLAVDGDRNSNFDHGSCTHTKQGDDDEPTWTLTFGWPHIVNRYLLFNRNLGQERLRGFILEADQQNGSVTFNYTEPTNTDHSVYTVLSNSPQTPVSSVKIVATDKTYGSKVLTLCEVEMYGDAVCEVGKYGRECNSTCKCDVDEQCFVSTGGCPLGCAAGYQGEGCQEPCSEKYYGVDCSSNCSTNCQDQLCQPTNGTCLSCLRGKQGPLCDKDCDNTFWGHKCSNSCSSVCKDKRCETVNGTCFSCVAGKSGKNCDQDCNATSYGENCALPCSSNCTGQLCNAFNGSCQSCVIGKSGDFCNEACPSRTFGEHCNNPCSRNCSDQSCDPVNGTCVSCVQGSIGEYCEHMMLVIPTDNSPPIAAIVGPVVAFVVLVALIVIGVLILRRRRHKKDVPEQTLPHQSQNYAEIDSIRNGQPTSSTTTPGETGSGHTKSKPLVMKKPKSSRDEESQANHIGGVYYNQAPGRSETAMRFDELDNFMATHEKDFFQEQFKRIPTNTSATTTAALSSENVNKNRYKNISAYDHSRVHLQTDVLKNHGDYINASYIDGFQQKKQFIASQGATKIILEDFVRMLWEQEVEVVVMLTSLVEDGKLKCEQYWPDDGEITIGEVTVKLTTTQVFADYTIRRLCLYKEKAPPVQVLTHFHFTTWPDKDVPTTAWGLVDLEQRMTAISTSKPIVVHCSAGVGRTGTFIALHNTLEQIKHTGYMDVFTTVQKLRQDRINMVQTCQQYEFLHKAIQIAMVCKGTTVTTRDIRDRIQTLELSESGQSSLEKEFKSVCTVCCEDEQQQQQQNDEVQESNTYCNSRLLTNRMKNRLDNVLPKEYYRPVLRCEIKELGDYINAVLIPSCEKHDQQILTQLPLPTTVIDFWRLVTQFKVTVIVAFERDLSTLDTTIGDYLPESDDETKTCSFLNIRTTGLDSVGTWDTHRITISVNEHGSKLANMAFKGEYRLSHLSWKSKDLDPKSLLNLMEKIRSMKPVGDGRTLFACRNGAELSGLACTMSLLLDRMDNDQHVSVPLVVGTLKAIRPQIIPTLEQYRLLYQTLNLFNETNNEYNNVGTA